MFRVCYALAAHSRPCDKHRHSPGDLETVLPLIKPFRALRPAPGRAAEVLAPPYDVLSSSEARERAKGKPWSFLHISKPEIDLDPATDPYDKAVYAKAAENLKRMIDGGVMIRDGKPCYYVYRLTWATARRPAWWPRPRWPITTANRIRKHELTTPRTRKTTACARSKHQRPDRPGDDRLSGRAGDRCHAGAGCGGQAGGRRHRRRRRPPSALGDRRRRNPVTKLSRAFEALPAIYIADGHHRSAAAARVAKARKADGSHSYFLSVIFPEREMTILDYNRVVKDLNGRSADQLLAELAKSFTVFASDKPVRPASSHDYGMYLAGRWYRLTIRPDLVPKDPIGRLPITVLTRNVIEPLLGIKDPRTDKRIDFIGGARGLEGLEKRVKSGDMAVAFALYPTQMTDLMAVADAGGIMPPKSTWFEPKLADGMVNYAPD